MKTLLSLVFALTVAGGLFSEVRADQDSTPGTRIRFIDNCTGEVISTTTPNGVSFEVDIDHLDRTRPLWFDLTIGPTDQPDGSDQFSTFRMKRLYYPKDGKWYRHLRFKSESIHDVVDRDGHFHLKRKIKIQSRKDRLLKGQVQPVWTARLRWTQGGIDHAQEGKAGSAAASIYLLESKEERFYRALGSAVCSWQMPVQIQSEYKYNGDIDDMQLGMSTKWREIQGKRITSAVGLQRNQNFGGVGVGSNQSFSPNPFINNPGGAPLGFAPWFFKYWRTTSASGGLNVLSRSWVLGTDQGGFFGTRYHFDRIPVEEYALHQPHRHECARWKVTRTGYLDLGTLETDFYVVPKSLASRVDTASEFIEKVSPTINSCGDHKGINSGAHEFRIPDSGDGMQFFYPVELNQ